VQTDATDTTSEGTATGGTALPPQQVFLVGPDHKAIARPVQVGIVTGSSAEITSGLQPGDKLVTVGQQQLKTGEAVKIESKANGVGAGLATE
jgi:multidrug efflux pump subunit AcrA (membrane-fusion protein)